MILRDCVAFVTGGSGGLGARIAATLAGQGVDIAVGYHTGESRAREVCRTVEGLGRRAIQVRLDQADADSVEHAVTTVTARLGRLDLLINNAGMASGGYAIPKGDLDAFTPAIWDEMMAVNLRGPYLLTRAAAAHLRASPRGAVVNVGSTIGAGTWGAAAAYAPSKGAVVALTRFLAAALAPDVVVNCVAPGLMEGTGLSGGAPGTYIKTWRERALTGRTTSLEDVAQQVAALCKTRTMTGQTVIVDGGIHLG